MELSWGHSWMEEGKADRCSMYLEFPPNNVCSAKGMFRYDIIMNNPIWLGKINYALFKNGSENSSCSHIFF